MGQRKEWLEKLYLMCQSEELKGRPFFSLLTMAQVTSPEVMQLTFGAWSVQDRVALEISRWSLNFSHHRDCSLKNLK